MADQIEEGEIPEMVGKDRDRSRSKTSIQTRGKDSDRRSSKEHDGRSGSSESSTSHRKSSSSHQKGDTTNSSNVTSNKSSSSSLGNTNSTAPSKSSNPVDPKSPVMLSKKDVYESVVEHENQLAVDVDVEKNATEFLETSETFQEVMKDIFDIKSAGPEKLDEEELDELKTEGLLLLGKLRHLNRISKLRLKLVKDEAFSRRQEVDHDHLLLQNLLYEAINLKKQVEAVQEYKGQDDEIELIPVDKFFKEAPPTISKPDLTVSNDHLLRIARLEHEFFLREDLANKCTELENEKDSVGKDIDSKRKKLENLRNLLQSAKEATKPIQEYYGMPSNDERTELKTSNLLPNPLYVLYVQSSAFKNAFKIPNCELIVKLAGDVDAAKEFVEDHDEEVEEETDSEADGDEPMEVDESNNTRRKQTKGSQARSTVLDPKKRIIQTHPLSVEWTLRATSGECITINFSYATKLKVVTVRSRVYAGIFSEKNSIPSLNKGDSILSGLFENDTGLECPNPSAYFFLQKAEIEDFSELVSELGKCYIWAQKAAGLDFPPLSNRVHEEIDGVSKKGIVELNQSYEASRKFTASSMEKTIKQIYKRLTNQTILWNQIKAIETKNMPIPSEARELFPPKVSGNLLSWEPVDLDSSNPAGAKALEFMTKNKLFSEPDQNHMLFKAIIERGRAKLTAYVIVGMNFPQVPPLFNLVLEQDGIERDSTNDVSIRDIEKEVNFYGPEEFQRWSGFMLTLQIHRLMVCMDILLETDLLLGETQGPSEFAREKLLLNHTKGRTHRRPFVFQSSRGYFTHRY